MLPMLSQPWDVLWGCVAGAGHLPQLLEHQQCPAVFHRQDKVLSLSPVLGLSPACPSQLGPSPAPGETVLARDKELSPPSATPSHQHCPKNILPKKFLPKNFSPKNFSPKIQEQTSDSRLFPPCLPERTRMKVYSLIVNYTSLLDFRG